MIRMIEHNDVVQFHRVLSKFNRKRLMPRRFDQGSWQDDLETEFAMRLAEGDMVQHEILTIRDWMRDIPKDLDQFLEWFENLKFVGLGQNDPVFQWLAEEATFPEMKWFIEQEVAGEAGFEDLVALTQVKFPARAKLELARSMHGPMLSQLSSDLGLGGHESDSIPEALALNNLLVAFATNRRFAYHSIGALGVTELTAPSRAKKILEGLKRLGVESLGQRYYLFHPTLDLKHSKSWSREVFRPIIQNNPQLIVPIAEGAILRLHAGARCFERYREVLWNKNPKRKTQTHRFSEVHALSS